MKKTILYLLLLMAVPTGFTACKGKKADTSTSSPTGDTATVSAPVEISNDDELRNGLKDATKDYPDVTATVANGEVTLTGNIKRDRLPNLMQSVMALHPKKVNNNLTVQP